jgi:hypothetical protein
MENILSKKVFIFFTVFLISLIFVFSSFDFVNADSDANDTMIVEVNLIGFGNASEVPEIAIEVPDYVFLGNVTKENPVSEENITISNIGRVNTTITPQLTDPDEVIFKWLFFRNYKTSTAHPDEAIPKKIGTYSVSIDKPATGSTLRSKKIYISLDLTDFDGNINEDIIGHSAEVTFFATAG